MSKNLIKNISVGLLIAWCLLDIYSVLQITDLFELVVGFFVATFIPLVILFLVSVSLKKSSKDWQKIVAFTGILISVATLMVNIVMFIIIFGGQN